MDTDPFAILGLERRFDLTTRQVRDAWRARASVQHPDACTQDDSLHGVTRNAAQLNAAKHVLLDPEQRADVMVVLLGGPSREAENSLPPDFLMEMLEVRESFQEAIAQADTQRIAHWSGWARDQHEVLLSRISEKFNAQDQSPDAQSLRAIRLELNKLRFIERMREQVLEVGQGFE